MLHFPHRFGIIYNGSEPQLYITDPELVKQITITDFDHFQAIFDGYLHEMKVNDFGLFTMHGEKWKILKSLLSPVFSSKEGY